MKALISILIIVGVIFTVWKLFDYWEKVNQQRERQERIERAEIDPRTLPGMSRELEQSLDNAYKSGARALRSWIDEQKRKNKLEDPRLAWIELDYVVKVSGEDPLEAKRVFAEVKARTPPDSKVYRRLTQLAKTYE